MFESMALNQEPKGQPDGDLRSLPQHPPLDPPLTTPDPCVRIFTEGSTGTWKRGAKGGEILGWMGYALLNKFF